MTVLNITALEAQSSLRYAIGSDNTVIECQVADEGLFPSTGDFYLILGKGDSARREIVLVTSRTTQELTVSRGQLSTTAYGHPAGESIEIIAGFTIDEQGIQQGVEIVTTPDNIEMRKVTLTSNVDLGNWANAIVGKIDLDATGYVSGLLSPICSEVDLPSSGVTGSKGQYYAFEAEINCPDGYDSGVPLGVLIANVWGDAAAQFDTYGSFFDITGLTANTGKIFQTGNTFANPAATLRVKVGGVEYFLPLYDTEITTV